MVVEIAVEEPKAVLDTVEGVSDMVLKEARVVLEAVFGATIEVFRVVLVIEERVLDMVLEIPELLLHDTDAEILAAETVATPIVKFAVETEAFREKAVPKGAGG